MALWRVIVVLGALAAAGAVDLPSSPYRVIHEPQADGSLQTWVDWGVAGPARARYPELIRDEVDGLRRFLASPEAVAAMIQLQQLAENRETEILQHELARYKADYETREQPTRFQRSMQRTLDEVPTPRWSWGIPIEVRTRYQVLLFDDRDPVQRQWAVSQGRREDYLSQAICTGWRSGNDRDTFWKATPGVFIHPVAGDQIADYYQVASYPARITWTAATMRIEQGMDPTPTTTQP